MATHKDFLDFVLDQLSGLEGVSYRPMMGEYVLYYAGKVVGGIYDDRLLLKPTEGALRLMKERGRTPAFELPYEGAKEMLSAEVDDRELTRSLIETIASELPVPKKKNKKGAAASEK